MIFPLSLKYKGKILFEINATDIETICNILENKFKELKVDKIIRKGNEIAFNNKIFNRQSNLNVLKLLDRGIIIVHDNVNEVKYEFSTKRGAIITFLMCTFFILIFQSWFVGIFLFAWLYGMNILIVTIRLNNLTRRITKEINSVKIKNI